MKTRRTISTSAKGRVFQLQTLALTERRREQRGLLIHQTLTPIIKWLSLESALCGVICVASKTSYASELLGKFKTYKLTIALLDPPPTKSWIPEIYNLFFFLLKQDDETQRKGSQKMVTFL